MKIGTEFSKKTFWSATRWKKAFKRYFRSPWILCDAAECFLNLHDLRS